MVDINLIGDDQNQFEDDKEDEEFQDSYGSESEDFAQNRYMKGGTVDNSEYAKVIRRRGSKTGVYILFIIVIGLLAVTAYLLFWPQKAGEPTKLDVSSQAITETETANDTSGITGIDVAEEPVEKSDYIAPSLKDLIVKSHHGINTINQIVNTIPAPVNFTMITYSDGKFLFEILALNDNEITQVNDKLKQKLNSNNLKLLSTDRRQVQGRQFRQALINGSVDVAATPQDENIVRQPTFLTPNELSQKLTSLCQKNGIKIKQLDTGVEKTEGELIIFPIKFRADGLKGNVLNLLQQLHTININLSCSKISLIANEADLNNPNITLVMNMALFRMI